MKNFTLLALAGILTPLVAPQIASAAPDRLTVEPGIRIGRIFLGDSKAAVARRLGKPTKTFKLSGGYDSQLWKSKTEFAPGERDTLEIVYKKGVVVQIEVTNPIFETPGGLSLNDTITDWRKKYGVPLEQTRYYTNKSDQRYYDWRKNGVAIESVLDGRGDTAPTFTFHTLIIHKKGVKVLPDPGGEL